MATYNEIDITMSPDGDLVLDSRKDLRMAAPSGVVKQDITFRARTEYDDFTPHPDIGADLPSLVGEPNSKENALMAEEKLFTSLTKDNRFNHNDIRVKAVPISMNSIVLYTFVNASNYNTNLFVASVLDYENGITNTSGG